jgi:AraC-like DNA-binding protein
LPPHNYSEALARPRPWIALSDVQRAVDFIEVNLDGPIVLADIVAASGIPGRTLAQHFHRFRGTTPMRYCAAPGSPKCTLADLTSRPP